MALIEEAHKAARILLDHAYVRIVARAEPDAACAATLLAHALRRENVDFHVSWAPRLDELTLRGLAEERPDCAVLLGLGGDAAGAPVGPARALVLDRVDAPLAGEAVVRDDASLASLAHLVAAGISRRNTDLAPLALAGGLASLRHAGGWRGLDAEVLREALDANVLVREAQLALHGATLAQALAQLDAPYVAGLTGRARNVKKLLGELHLSADAPPTSLADADAQQLGDFLALRLLQQHAPDGALDLLFRPALRAVQGPLAGLECGELARLAEACCASGRPGVAFAALWPDAAAGGEAIDLVGDAREQLVQALFAAERDARRDGPLLVAEAPHASLCRPLADRLAVSLAPADAVVAAHAPDGAGATIALRSLARDVRPLAARLGSPAAAGAREATAWVPDVTRALKALAEAGA